MISDRAQRLARSIGPWIAPRLTFTGVDPSKRWPQIAGPHTGWLLIATLLIFGSNRCLANEPPIPEEQAMHDLLSVVEDATSLATKSRMNVDFVPGFVSVLHGEEMVALGVRTVGEALNLMPGIQSYDMIGVSTTAIRGNLQGGLRAKILIDSVPINDAYIGGGYFVGIPIEQIERIELIRGPGSALYGEFALAGVINIVTRKDGNGAYLRAGSHDSLEGGALLTLEDPAHDWRLNLNLSGWTQDAYIRSGTDLLYEIGQGDLSRAPGPVDNSAERGHAFVSLDIGDFSLLASYARGNLGSSFGVLGALPEIDDAAYPQWRFYEQLMVDARQTWRLSETLEMQLNLSWLQTRSDSQDQLLPPGVDYPLFSGNVIPDGLFERAYQRNTRWDAGLRLNWGGWENHRWLLELMASEIRLEDAGWAFNVDLTTLEPLPEMRRYTGDMNFIEEDASRSIRSLVAQDEYRVTEQLKLTVGVRYDHYSDVGENLSPRLAAVWRVSDAHLLKAQYAEAFFPPTLLQYYGTTSTVYPQDPETSATTELGYIFRQRETAVRVTLFRSQIRDVIAFQNGAYQNLGGARLQGVEAEWEQRFTQTWKLKANLSYTDTLNRNTGGPLPGAATWLGNLSLFYRPREDLLLTAQWHAVGERLRGSDDPRTDPLAGYNELALTINWFDVAIPRLTLRTGVRNLLGETLKAPAPPLTYRDDYPILDEPTWWLQVSYRLD